MPLRSCALLQTKRAMVCHDTALASVWGRRYRLERVRRSKRCELRASPYRGSAVSAGQGDLAHAKLRPQEPRRPLRPAWRPGSAYPFLFRSVLAVGGGSTADVPDLIRVGSCRLSFF